MSCGNPHETDCREVLERVYEFLDGEMTDHDVAKIRQHLDECSPCLTQYDLDLMLKALVRRSCVCETAPDSLRSRIMVQITEVRLQLEG
ncbi:MAG: mycothiol system anti-sigma-R factor [Kineosporiaceae bacterium]|nr:mycothiol system anti-sigma-R factor [Kineosporiaceae bacterium]MBK7622489.1 mycothiol system anti-sigma-R factor [Kineosporiaceae bacterium]MBK8078403.1 mycothiol system anti-sigma-R factor [Kineosporiaceae bacterium]